MNTMTSMILPTRRPASERSESNRLSTFASSTGRAASAVEGISPFDLAERLAQVWSRNERRLGEVAALDASIAAARLRLETKPTGRARADAAGAEELTRDWDARRAVRRAVGG
jgi:hypothetical protein